MSTQQLQSRDNLIFTTINVAILGPSVVLLFDLIICNRTRFLLVSNIRNRRFPSPNFNLIFRFFVNFQIGEKKKVYFFNSCPVDQRTFHFCTIRREEKLEFESVEWISENRVAAATLENGIEIWEIDKSTATAQEVQKLKPNVSLVYLFTFRCTFSSVFSLLFL